MKRMPPAYDWFQQQPAGWVAEIKAAWDALIRRENYETEQAILRMKQGGQT